MTPAEAVLGFSQSEKIKSGLVWAEHLLQQLEGLPAPQQAGAVPMAQALVALIAHEAQLARRRVPDKRWEAIQKHLDTALVMIRSGVPAEAPYHLTRALSEVTAIGSVCLGWLQRHKLFPTE